MTEQQPEADAVSVSGEGAEGKITCGSCGAQVEAGVRVCPQCAHSLYRTCVCGRELPAGELTCPYCGAKGRRSRRVVRRSHARHPRRSEAIRYALIGSAAALGGVILLYLLATLLSLAAPGTEGALPPSLFNRLVLAGRGIAHVVGSVAAALARHSGVILGAVLVIAIGALGGVATYLMSLRCGSPRSRSGSGRRPVRRKRRP